MKYIFDFDDVIFQTTKHRKERLYIFLEKLGIPIEEIDEYYKKIRSQNFSVKKILRHFSLKEEFYNEIMQNCVDFANQKLIDVIKTLGRENCFIITYGEEEFQLDKIKRIGVENSFSKIFVVVADEKKELIEQICTQYKNEPVLFIDDKMKHFESLDLVKFPNLKTILFDENGLEKLKQEIINYTQN